MILIGRPPPGRRPIVSCDAAAERGAAYSCGAMERKSAAARRPARLTAVQWGNCSVRRNTACWLFFGQNFEKPTLCVENCRRRLIKLMMLAFGSEGCILGNSFLENRDLIFVERSKKPTSTDFDRRNPGMIRKMLAFFRVPRKKANRSAAGRHGHRTTPRTDGSTLYNVVFFSGF